MMKGPNSFNLEDGGCIFLRNASFELKYYTMWKYSRIQYETFVYLSSSC